MGTTTSSKKAALIIFALFFVLGATATTTTTATEETQTETLSSCPANSNDGVCGNNENAGAGEDNNKDTVDGDGVVRRKAFLEFWASDASRVQQLTSTQRVMDWLECDATDLDSIDDAEAYQRVPTDEDYRLLVEAYVHSMTTAATTDRPPSVASYDPGVFRVPVEVRSVPHVGRGVYAREDIPEGTLVNRPTNAMEFYSHENYRDFLAYLVEKGSAVVCDTFLWMYATRKSPKPDDWIICIDADHSSLTNSGEWHFDDDDDDYYYLHYYIDENGEDAELAFFEEINIGQYIKATNESGERVLYGCQDPPVYAYRDIEAGEELLQSYGDFAESQGFSSLGIAH